jgi:PEP-CTERM motif
MRRVCVTLALAALLPVAARAEPIGVSVESSTGGFSQTGTVLGDQFIDLGTVTMTGGESGVLLMNGLRTWANYNVVFSLEGIGGATTLRMEILDPNDGDDGLDQGNRPAYVPAGYSTSNNMDGFSFAQNADLQRSAVFAGGTAIVTADEGTHRGDILLFSGLTGAENARVSFGLRDSSGGRAFLIRLSLDGSDTLSTPEPASMILIGTGLVGMAGAIRRRRRNTDAVGIS